MINRTMLKNYTNYKFSTLSNGIAREQSSYQINSLSKTFQFNPREILPFCSQPLMTKCTILNTDLFDVSAFFKEVFSGHHI